MEPYWHQFNLGINHSGRATTITHADKCRVGTIDQWHNHDLWCGGTSEVPVASISKGGCQWSKFRVTKDIFRIANDTIDY